MSFTFTFFKSMAGHCTVSSVIATMTHGRLVSRVDQDVDDQGHEEEHVDEASLKPRELFPLSPATVRLCRLLICAQARKVQRHKVRPGRHFQRMPLDLSQITFNRSNCF